MKKIILILLVESVIILGGCIPNHAPTIPSDPTPANGAIDVTTNVTLTWNCSDSDGDTLKYDIYFGTSSTPPMVRNDSRITSYYPGTLEPDTLYYWKIVAKDGKGGETSGPVWRFTTDRLKWKFPTNDAISSSPAIGNDGTIYVGSRDSYLYAIKPDGTLKWKFQTNSDICSSPTIGSDGTIYVGTLGNYLYAIKPDGTLKWKFNTNGSIHSSGAIGSDGTIYVGEWSASVNDSFYAINPDGTLKWKFNPYGSFESSPVIGNDGTVYVYGGDLHAISPDGTLIWSFNDVYGRCDSAPAIGSDGTIYIGTWGNYLYAINPDGTLKWKFLTNGDIHSSAAIGSDGTIYVGSSAENLYDNVGSSDDCYLYAINPDGTLKWKYKTSAADSLFKESLSSPVIGSDGTIYVGSNNIYFYAINPDGTLKWKYRTDGSLGFSPAIGNDGTIYVGTWGSHLYAIHSESNGLADSSWPKFGKNNRNTGNTNDIE